MKKIKKKPKKIKTKVRKKIKKSFKPIKKKVKKIKSKVKSSNKNIRKIKNPFGSKSSVFKILKVIKSIDLKEGDLILITGSLYGAAEILNLN